MCLDVNISYTDNGMRLRVTGVRQVETFLSHDRHNGRL